MSGMQFGNKRGVNRLAMAAMGMVMAQSIVLAQTSEDKNQSGQQSSGKMNPKSAQRRRLFAA